MFDHFLVGEMCQLIMDEKSCCLWTCNMCYLVTTAWRNQCRLMLDVIYLWSRWLLIIVVLLLWKQLT